MKSEVNSVKTFHFSDYLDTHYRYYNHYVKYFFPSHKEPLTFNEYASHRYLSVTPCDADYVIFEDLYEKYVYLHGLHFSSYPELSPASYEEFVAFFVNNEINWRRNSDDIIKEYFQIINEDCPTAKRNPETTLLIIERLEEEKRIEEEYWEMQRRLTARLMA